MEEGDQGALIVLAMFYFLSLEVGSREFILLFIYDRYSVP